MVNLYLSFLYKISPSSNFCLLSGFTNLLTKDAISALDIKSLGLNSPSTPFPLIIPAL